MRIAIDIRKINEFGVGTYIWNLVRNIAVLDTGNEYLLLGTSRHLHELGPLPPNFKQLYNPEGNSFLNNHWKVPALLRRNQVDVFHVPHHEAPLFPSCKLVVTIHDCVHLLFPQEDESQLRKHRAYLRTKRIVDRAKHIIAVSNSTKADLSHIFETPEWKVSVVHNALDERFVFNNSAGERKQVLERYQLNDPFILYSGRIRPHKNLHRLIEAFAVLKSELTEDERYKSLKLIIIGDELSKHQYLRLTVIRSGVQQDVRFFGFVPYPILRVFYQSAALFAFPSLYEGFGLPPLEAMANRTAVIASNSSSLPEVLEDAAVLVNPENVFDIARGMKSILLDNALRKKLIERGIEQVKKFSWKIAAQKVIETYEFVENGRTSPAWKAVTSGKPAS
jgi:glycosyltransferase involved in cell wall biosynthesis